MKWKDPHSCFDQAAREFGDPSLWFAFGQRDAQRNSIVVGRGRTRALFLRRDQALTRLDPDGVSHLGELLAHELLELVERRHGPQVVPRFRDQGAWYDNEYRLKLFPGARAAAALREFPQELPVELGSLVVCRCLEIEFDCDAGLIQFVKLAQSGWVPIGGDLYPPSPFIVFA